MIRQTAIVVSALSLLVTAGCNRADGNNMASANKTAPNTAAPAANASANAASSAAPSQTQMRLALSPGGLEAMDPQGRVSPLNFGGPVAQAIDGLTRMFGAPSGDNVNTDCGAGPTRIVQWSNGLRILGQNDQLQGWEIDRPGIAALGDLQVGMTRAQLDANQASYEQTSLGTEWTVGDGDVTVSGLLSDATPGATVTHMWAGLTCHMT